MALVEEEALFSSSGIHGYQKNRGGTPEIMMEMLDWKRNQKINLLMEKMTDRSK